MARFVISLILSLGWLVLGRPRPVAAIPPTASVAIADQGGGSLRPSQACPTDLPSLTTALLRDLPAYANRLASRSLGSLVREAGPAGTVLIASNPDFEPLDLTQPSLSSGLDQDPQIHQVFFTTLERQYLTGQVVALQQYHWLFLVDGPEGWHLALLYSSLGPYPGGNRPASPPQESSDGLIGQAIRLWLRDCRAGAVSVGGASTRE